MKKIGEIFTNRNKTLERLESLGFDVSDCICVGENVVWGNVSFLWLKHSDYFSVTVRCPDCLDVMNQFFSAQELMNGIQIFDKHKCDPYRIVGRFANFISDLINEM